MVVNIYLILNKLNVLKSGITRGGVTVSSGEWGKSMNAIAAGNFAKNSFFSSQMRCVSKNVRLMPLWRCNVSYSVVAIASVMFVGTNIASGANYSVSNEGELAAAIAQANLDGDPSSTITLTGNVDLANPAGLPAINKTLTIDIGSYKLTTSLDSNLNVAGGAELKFIGQHFGSGQLVKIGDGTVILSSSGSYNNPIVVNGGKLYIQDGALVTSGTAATGGLNVAHADNTQAAVVISGAGTELDVKKNAIWLAAGKGSTAALTIESGAALTIDNSVQAVVNNSTSRASLTVTGKGSRLESNGVIFGAGKGTVLIEDGGQIQSRGTVVIGGNAVGIATGGTTSVSVAGDGSTWTAAAKYYLVQGDLSINDGGVVQASQLFIGNHKDGTAVAVVSGKGARLVNTGSGAADLSLGTGGSGTVTVKNGGKVTTGNGTGIIKVATSVTGKGTLNIGGAEGEAAAEAGTIEASAIEFGAGAGTLNFNHIEKEYVFDIAVKGNGTINQIGSGRTSFNADQTAFTGITNIEDGILSVNGRLGGTMNVFGGRLQGIGTVGSTVLGMDGIIAPGNSIGTLTIDGNLEGKGGLVEIETVLGGDNSQTDRLVVTGDTSGTANLRVVNLGGAGAPTVEGIKIIEIGGKSDGVFSLQGNYPINGEQVVVGGAYAYRLVKNGVTDPADGDWYLRSELKPEVPVTPVDPGNTQPADPTKDPEPAKPLYQAGAPLYEVYPQVLQELNALPTLQQRVGNRYWTGENDQGLVVDGNNSIWGRAEGAHNRLEARKTTAGASHETDIWKLQAGIDGQFYESEAGKLIGSITGHYGKASADVTSVYGWGTIDTDAYGVGGTLTWYGDNGFYLDGQGQATWFDSDLFSGTAAMAEQGLANGNRGFGYAFSLETGKRTAITPGWTLTPQAQLVYSSVDFDSFDDSFNARVSLRSGDSLTGRLGLSADYEERWQGRDGLVSRANVYGIANLYYDFLDGTKVNLAGLNFVNDNDPLWGGVGLGGTYGWAGGKYALYGETLLKTSLSHPSDSLGVNGTVGLKVAF